MRSARSKEKIVPETSNSIIILKPLGQTFINGLSSQYDNRYPPELKNYIEKFLYEKYIYELNATLKATWPCFCIYSCGYFCFPFTLGLSFLLPYTCIKDTEKMFIKQLEQYNDFIFKERGFRVKLVKKCSTSWLEIKINKEEGTEAFLETGPGL